MAQLECVMKQAFNAPVLKASESSHFKDATDATFTFTNSEITDKALGKFGEFKLTTLQGSAVATLITPDDDLAGQTTLKTLAPTTFNYNVDLSKSVVLTGEVVLNGKQKKLTATFYSPADGKLAAALVGDVDAGFTGFVRNASFTWSPA